MGYRTRYEPKHRNPHVLCHGDDDDDDALQFAIRVRFFWLLLGNRMKMHISAISKTCLTKLNNRTD